MNDILLTIFTPTFNRGYILDKCYQSLCNQTDKRFIWIVVDDGSQDNTKELIHLWMKQGIIEIQYYYQKNQGKPSAHNLAIQKCQTEIAVCLDSDDQFAVDAVEVILNAWQNDENQVIGILAPKGHLGGVKKNYQWPSQNTKRTTLGELYSRYHYKGEATIVLRTELAKRYPFPVYENEKLIGEDYLYVILDTIGDYLVIKNEFYLWEYLEDGYTKSGNVMFYPKSYKAHAEILLDYSPFIIVRIKAAARMWYSIFIGTGKIKKFLKGSSLVIALVAFPLGIALFIKRRVMHRK